MDFLLIFLTIIGLTFFEVITGIDNAIINAEILSKMSEKAKRWFLVWGIFIAVFVVRGLLPWLMVWLANPQLGPIGAFTATLSSDPAVVAAVEASAPVLQIGGGLFLIFLFFHWLFLETKHFGLRGEKFIQSNGVWFFAVASIILAIVTWFAINKNPFMAFGAVIGSTAFFIVHGFKQNAEQTEKLLMQSSSGSNSSSAMHLSDLSKLLYLEIIDATFSVDGVIGAFAFTLAVPLILIGNGIGAFVVRELTLRNIENVKKYVFLKNGAMYSILFLGAIMILDAFSYRIPSWISPVITFGVVGYFLWRSHVHLKANGNPA